MTLLEVLVAVAILAVLAAILMPVISTARARAAERVCVSNLKQLSLALLMYRTENGGDGKYGEAAEMGLPTNLESFVMAQRVPKELFRCTGRPNGYVAEKAVYSVYFLDPGAGEFAWSDYAHEAKEDAILIGDVNHTDPMPQPGDDYFPRKGIGLRLSGQVFTQTRAGRWNNLRWWDRR